MRDFIIGTAGHIDHGKTTLIRALTGVNTDRLEEEKRRGITIDIGFASMQLDDYRIGFIDVPGHEKFVKNMLAGIGGIEMVLLVVAADESVMPQTVEHFHICRLLEIPRGIIVLTKKDLADPEFLSLVEEDVRSLAKGSFLEKAPVVPIDSMSGEGMPELLETLRSELEALDLHERDDTRVFRLPIDRVFSLQGFGTIVTGTPVSGVVRKGQTLQAYPFDKIAKIRGIEVFGLQEEEALAGRRTAINVTGPEKSDLRRGMILAPPETFRPSHMFDMALSILENAPAPIRHRAPIRFHHGSAELIGRLYLMGKTLLEPGESGFGQIRLDTPTVACPMDHFILRRYSPVTTIGGGIILDNAPRKVTRKGVSHRLPSLDLVLESRHDKGLDAKPELVRYLVKTASDSGLTLQELVSRTGFSRNHLNTLLANLPDILLVPQDPPLAIHRPAFDDLQARVLRFLEDFHSNSPLAPGVPQEELKTRFFRRASPAYFQFALSQMSADRLISISGAFVSNRNHQIQLTDPQKEVRTAILSSFKQNRLSSPALQDLLKSSDNAEETRRIFFYLLQRGELVRITEEVVLSQDQVTWLKKTLRSRFSTGDTFGVAEFKDLFGLSRKYAIPFLEFLDREKVTRRIGDRRLVV